MPNEGSDFTVAGQCWILTRLHLEWLYGRDISAIKFNLKAFYLWYEFFNQWRGVMENNMNIEERYMAMKSEISALAVKSGRSPEAVQLMLVSKTVPVERMLKTIELGHKLYGENKVQELSEKAPALADKNIDFHFIGHLQSNKVKRCLELASMIHSVDRMSLALELNQQLLKTHSTMDILIQVNTSQEESKFGVHPDEALQLVESVAKLSQLHIKGLMTLAKFSSNEDEVRPCFQLLKRLSDELKAKNIPGVEMRELSMGMSSDYRIAIEEGATIVRVGTAIFGKRDTPDSYYWPEDKSI